jgi:hypothetical protein
MNTTRFRVQMEEFMRGEWVTKMPDQPGRYPVCGRGMPPGGESIVVYYNPGLGRAVPTSTWGGWWWSAPMPDLPCPPDVEVAEVLRDTSFDDDLNETYSRPADWTEDAPQKPLRCECLTWAWAPEMGPWTDDGHHPNCVAAHPEGCDCRQCNFMGMVRGLLGLKPGEA